MTYEIGSVIAGLLNPSTLVMMLVGCVGGIIIGAIPGLSGSTGIILLLPLIYNLDMLPALVVMAGMFCGTMYGGSLPAILIQAPGTPSAAATSLNGYPLAQQGKAGKAITVALVASVSGGLLSGLCMMFISPHLAKFALKFQAPEYFALALFGLTLIASSSSNFLKGLISGFVGLLLSCVGMDVLTGSSRFTFDTTLLSGGIGVLPLLFSGSVFSGRKYERCPVCSDIQCIGLFYEKISVSGTTYDSGTDSGLHGRAESESYFNDL